MKKILFNDPMAPIVSGVNKIAPLLLSSIGPDKGIVICGGKIVSLYSGLLTYIRHEDPFEHIATHLIEDVANEVYNKAGAGVSLASVLTVGLVRNVRKLLVAGYSAHEVSNWLSRLDSDFKDHLKHEILETRDTLGSFDEQKLLCCAATTAAKDEDIGKIIGDMCYRVGPIAHVAIEQDDQPDLRVEYREGFSFKTHPLAYQFLKTKKKEFIQPRVLITSAVIEDLQGMVDILVHCNQQERPLIVIANGLSPDVQSLLLHNFNIGALDIMALKAPMFTYEQHLALQDLAFIAQTKVVDPARADKLSVLSLGSVSKAMVGREYCTLQFEKSVPKEYTDPITSKLTATKNRLQMCKYSDRLSNLRGLTAVLRIGGYTEKDKETNYYRVESTLHATRGAQNEGYIPGGYQIFRRFSDFHKRQEIPQPLYDAMRFPYDALMGNYNGDVPSCDRTTENPLNLFNVRTGQIESMLDNGIVDSAKAIRVAVESSISITKTLALTGAIVVEE